MSQCSVASPVDEVFPVGMLPLLGIQHVLVMSLGAWAAVLNDFFNHLRAADETGEEASSAAHGSEA